MHADAWIHPSLFAPGPNAMDMGKIMASASECLSDIDAVNQFEPWGYDNFMRIISMQTVIGHRPFCDYM